MNIVSVKCPNCGASIDLDPDNLSNYCAKCGAKLMLDIEQIQELLIAKEETRRKQIESDKEIELQKIKQEEYIIDKKIEHKHAMSVIMIPVGILLLLFLGIALLFMSMDGTFAKWGDSSKIKQLKSLSSQIEECVNDRDYDQAEVFNRQLNVVVGELEYYKNKETWESQYSIYRILIEKSKRENEKAEPSSIKITYSDEALKKNTVSDVKEYFEEIGFWNIQSSPVSKDFFSFWASDPIKDISINGDKDFTEGDEFLDDSEVIIYYFD